LVIWDGECAFCRAWMSRLNTLAGDRLDFATIDRAAAHFPGTPTESFQQAVHLMMPGGDQYRGAAAMVHMMKEADIRGWPATLYRHVPPLRWAADACYRWIASHRTSSLVASRLLFGSVARPSTLLLTRRTFLRLIGLIYMIAFVSFGQQGIGLVGDSGLQPVAERLTHAAAGGASWWQLPTLQWLGGDGVLTASWIAGTICSTLLLLGLIPLVSSIGCWLMYLSLVTAGGVFMQFQWDALLLECGLLAVLWAPCTWRLTSPNAKRPSVLVHWLVVLVLARLVFFGGLAKLQSGDATWADCTALSYHFWTQPLPWWPAWIAAEAPGWLLQFGCMCMFIIELICPVLLLGPRVPRAIGALSIALLMFGIAATGNYGYFNWLTIVLCIAMLDDATLRMAWPSATRGLIQVGLRPRPGRMAIWMRRIPALVVLMLVLMSIRSQMDRQPPTGLVASIDRWAAPWHPVGRYGLFATMTTTRPEIRIDWQDDALAWHPLIFSWKPGPTDRCGRLSQPGMPRLDWQLWFDALSYERALAAGTLTHQSPLPRVSGREVLPSLLQRLLEHDESVLALLETSPSSPPRAVRWHLDAYRFTTAEERSESGQWWRSTPAFSSPPLSLPPGPS